MSADLLAYVAARVKEDGGCLRWTGTVFNGHPGGTINKRKVLIRRELYALKHGPIPKGRILRCTCETPLCVDEEHVKLTTFRAVGKECGAKGLMSGPVRSARIAAAKRASACAKITQDDARAIRASDDKGRVLAKRYGVSESTISKIRLGKVRRDFGAALWAAPLFARATA